MATLGQDTFNRTSTGLGTASDTQVWQVLQGSVSFSVTPSEGTGTGATAITNTALGTTTPPDTNSRIRFQVSSTSDGFGLVTRQSGSGTTSSRYRLSVTGTTLTLAKTVSGTSTTLGTATVTLSANTFYWLRLSVIGTTIQGKMWADGTSEPSTWTIASVTDTSLTSGLFGFYTKLNLTSDIVTFDSYTVTDGVASNTNYTTTITDTQLSTYSAETSVAGSGTTSISDTQLPGYDANATIAGSGIVPTITDTQLPGYTADATSAASSPTTNYTTTITDTQLPTYAADATITGSGNTPITDTSLPGYSADATIAGSGSTSISDPQLAGYDANATTRANVTTTIVDTQLTTYAAEATTITGLYVATITDTQLATYSAETTVLSSVAPAPVLGITISVSGIPVHILEGSFSLEDTLETPSIIYFTIRDDTGTQHYTKGQTVTISDSQRGVFFTGEVKTAEASILSPNKTILTKIGCIDNHETALNRVFVGPEWVNLSAGAIATDLLNTLANEGITAQYASRRETTGLQLAQGTLSNTTATGNVGDGDLELTPAGGTVSVTETRTADWSAPGSTLVGTYGVNDQLTLFPNDALKLQGTSQQGSANNYAYIKIWEGAVALAAGDTLRYFIWISSTSPAAIAGVDGICTDGTILRGLPIYDQQSITLHPGGDLSGYASDARYFRQLDLSTAAGKTLASIEVALEGDPNGTYTAYFDTIQLFDSTSTLKQTFFLHNLQKNIVISNVGYSTVSLTKVTSYTNPGYRTSPIFSLGSVGIARSSQVNWNASPATQNAKTPQVTIETTLDGGATWQPCTNHGPIPGLVPGQNMTGLSIQFRHTLAIGGSDPTISPILYDMNVTISPSYAATKTDVANVTTSQADWNAGTLSNVTSIASGSSGALELTGAFKSYGDGSVGSRTLFGSNPADGINLSSYYLRCDGGLDARARLDFVGTWSDGTIELDVQFGNSSSDTSGNYGIVYRTSNWGNTNNTYGYAAYIDANGIHLDRGSNSSGTVGNLFGVAVFSVSLASGVWYRLKVVATGSNHKVYVNDVLYINATDTTYSSGGVGYRHFNSLTNTRHNAYFKEFGIIYQLSGNRVSPYTNLTSVGSVGSSVIQWNATVPNNASLLVETSIGGTWQACANGGAIPQLTPGLNLSGVNLQIRATLTSNNANVTVILQGLTWLVTSAFNATGTRIGTPLSLQNVGRLGNSLVAWNRNLPAGTALGVDTSIDNGATWQDVTAQNGGSIPGLGIQPDPTIDSFATNTAANYTSTYRAGGTAATYTFDSANRRMVATGGASALCLYSTLTATDIDLFTDMDASDSGGLVWRYTDTNTFYEVVVQDASSNAGNPNTLAIYEVEAGVRSLVASSAINFQRVPVNTYHRVRVTMLGNVITAFFDGLAVATYTDPTPLAGGTCGLRTGGGTARFYQLRMQPQGDDVTARQVLTRLRLSSTNPAFTPQVLDLTLSAHSPAIGNGAIIPSTQYGFKSLDANFSDLAKKFPNGWWYIDKNMRFNLQGRTSVPAPWIGSTNGGDFLDAGLTVRVEGDLYRNRQYITNVLATIAINEQHQGDSVSISWTLGNALASAPTITVNNGPPALVGISGIDTGKDFYYTIGSPIVTADPSKPIYDSTQTITFTGTGQYLTYSQYDDVPGQQARAQLRGGSGIVENVEDGTGLTKAAGDQLAQARVQQYGVIGQMLTATTLRGGLAPGQLFSVFVPEHNLTDVQMLIRSVKTVFTTGPGGVPVPWFTIQAVSGPDLGDFTKLFQRQL